jgi:NAD(P)-dependent dehydrogenase (short-subunit alcohol dehydrogenase family)
MKIVVITGSSRGIGLGLADAFLARGCRVVLSGSSLESTQKAEDLLKNKYDQEMISGVPCDVRRYEQVQALWDGAIALYGTVDIWINNAGLSGPTLKLWNQTPEISKTVIETNLLGVIFGSQVALKGMFEQNYGCIYNMEGMGSDGRMHDGLTLYGMTKYGLKYFTDSLVKETQDTPIIIGALRPGMVVTDLILDQYKDKPEEWTRVKRIFNIIADRVENVTPVLVDRILSNQVTGKRINYNSRLTILKRFLSIPFSKRDVFYDSEL